MSVNRRLVFHTSLNQCKRLFKNETNNTMDKSAKKNLMAGLFIGHVHNMSDRVDHLHDHYPREFQKLEQEWLDNYGEITMGEALSLDAMERTKASLNVLMKELNAIDEE